MKKLIFISGLIILGFYQTTWSYMDSSGHNVLQNEAGSSLFSSEKIPVFEVENCYYLGKKTALCFLKWVTENPEGVISLPTGKTPEMFIKALEFYKENWGHDDVRQECADFGIQSDYFPDTSELKFVQMDEFFLMTPRQQNSFASYVLKHYIQFFGIKKENCLLMDFSAMNLSHMNYNFQEMKQAFEDKSIDLELLVKEPKDKDDIEVKNILQQMETVCLNYEKQIEQWGGIGFFLGGIGPDGHIAFNMSGSSFDSKTRLVKLNYSTAAAAAVSLGGIEYSRDKIAMTIGLQTILYNPNVKVVLFAAGESKAPIVAQTVQGDVDTAYPGTVFQGHKDVQFFITSGAAKYLTIRKYNKLRNNKINLSCEQIDDVIIDYALKNEKKLADLTVADFMATDAMSLFADNYQEVVAGTIERLKCKVDVGLQQIDNKNILHTAPHHDDVMLSYHAYAVRNLPQNRNIFAYLTSGFNSVGDQYIKSLLHSVAVDLLKELTTWIFQTGYNYVIEKFAEAYVEKDEQEMRKYEQIIMFQNMVRTFKCHSVEALWDNILWMQHDYFPAKYHGQRDNKEMQQLKGYMRESEVDRMWAIDTKNKAHVKHFRSGFYNGHYFTPQPQVNRDVMPLLNYLNEHNPHIVTVALDPEGTGPDTHYKVLQLVAQALEMHGDENIQVWGYRNVWHRFTLAEATVIVPVTQEEIDHMESIFLHCFSTQKEASFPSIYHDGPFSELIQKEQKQQWKQLRVLLGDDFFDQYPNELMQKAVGCIFLKTMSVGDFLKTADHLKNIIE